MKTNNKPNIVKIIYYRVTFKCGHIYTYDSEFIKLKKLTKKLCPFCKLEHFVRQRRASERERVAKSFDLAQSIK